MQANVLLDQNDNCKVCLYLCPLIDTHLHVFETWAHARHRAFLQVADFGLSRDVTDSNRDFTQNIGTVAYMPPEALETVNIKRIHFDWLQPDIALI